MKAERRWWAVPLLGAVAAVGCAQVFGLDKEYRLAEDAGTGGSGGSAEGSIGLLGEACPQFGTLACSGHAQKSKLICGPDGKWATNGTCDGETLCDTAKGLEQGTCKPSLTVCAGKRGADVVCDGTKRVRCGPDLLTTDEVEACTKACLEGKCGGVCKPESKQCAGNTPQTCDTSGAWQDGTACSAQTETCVAGTCVVMTPSCAGLPATCGSDGNETCCTSNLVAGGSFDRDNDKTYPATVSSFRLDRFEITVGRFRKFVAAYPDNKPKADAGAHPLITGSGWKAMWDINLPQDQPALVAAVKCDSTYQTWTDSVGANENLPVNCITWYEALAFCAWDGGRLPTEAEWSYAATGGDEQRSYPWGAAIPDSTYAVYDCTGQGADAGGCTLTGTLKVGSKPKGDGKWGQADLSGNVWEWNLDWYQSLYPTAVCNNCANLTEASDRAVRGGSWYYGASPLLSSGRYSFVPTTRYSFLGARCARTP